MTADSPTSPAAVLAAPAAERPSRRLEGFAVRSGVWATAIPFPSPLAYTLSYALRYPSGIVVVDLGWNSDDAWDAFCRGLTRAGSTLDDVLGVVATHAHPDHYGLARRIREHTGAWLATHPAERSQIRVDEGERRQRVADIEAWLRECGVPAPVMAGLQQELTRLDAALPTVEPDVMLADGVAVPGTEGRLVALHTPGHTPGSVCFHETELDLVFTGDHVLPKVTPNVSRRPGSDPDPLRDFVSSLARLRHLPEDSTALPGHEWPFDRLTPRLEVIDAHHEHRLAEIEQAVGDGCSTVWDVAQAVSWARAFVEFTPRSLRSALGETYAHLVRLTVEGRLAQQAGPPEQWKPSPR